MATYKTDWSSDDYINFGDWNRIEQNMLDLATYLQSIQYAVPTPTVVTNRTVSSVDYLSSINRIETNLEAIHFAFNMTPPEYLDTKVWTAGQGFTYADVNRLESNTQIIKTYGDLVAKSFRWSGAFTCGQEGGLY
ncbi:hypothetical protein [Paenibacillus sp. OV219]|uniref:hypothetical protein n=1 Tax=Paenibacillus sp. OV219 TaxID=1884377 RepID=UPI0008AD6141|nr:hypothetical protein [Paenibacillus sp. OV219]SEN19473.1 hypothetical protein SAMN05518847_102386 [Paenibacillus sp. OV219]